LLGARREHRQHGRESDDRRGTDNTQWKTWHERSFS
jgi:hypothetical protein